jgi:hypothetical protein
MKKALVLAGVLCLQASAGRAAYLEAWLTSDNMNPAANATFNVTIWLQVFGGASEDISQHGIRGVTISVYQQNPPGNCGPVPVAPFPPPQAKIVTTTDNYAAFDANRNAPLRQDGNGDGYLDALQAQGVTSGLDLNVGVSAPVWLCTEVWREAPVPGPTTLHVVVDDAYQWGVFYPGSVWGYYQTTDLVINAPEPATLSLLAVGAMVTLRRKK